MHFMKQFGYFNASKTHDDTIDDDAYVPWLHVAGFSVLGSYSIYFGLGGFLHVKSNIKYLWIELIRGHLIIFFYLCTPCVSTNLVVFLRTAARQSQRMEMPAGEISLARNGASRNLPRYLFDDVCQSIGRHTRLALGQRWTLCNDLLCTRRLRLVVVLHSVCGYFRLAGSHTFDTGKYDKHSNCKIFDA